MALPRCLARRMAAATSRKSFPARIEGSESRNLTSETFAPVGLAKSRTFTLFWREANGYVRRLLSVTGWIGETVMVFRSLYEEECPHARRKKVQDILAPPSRLCFRKLWRRWNSMAAVHLP